MTINFSDGTTIDSGGSLGKVLQTVSTAKTNTSTFSVTGGGTSGDIVTVSITPSSSSNKILIFASLTASKDDTGIFLKLFRDSTQIALGNSSGNRQRFSTHAAVTQNFLSGSTTCVFLDEPSSTSSITYKIKAGHGHPSTQTIAINKPESDGVNANQIGRGVSVITVQEVSG